MNNTHGDILYSPTTNGPTINDLVYRQKPEDTTTGGILPNRSIGDYQSPRGEVGWICPVCGRGLAPSTSYCPCHLNNHNNNICNEDLSINDYITTTSTPPEAHFATTATQK